MLRASSSPLEASDPFRRDPADAELNGGGSMVRRRASVAAIAVAAACAAGAALLRHPGPPPLRLYVSPPIDSAGRRVRVLVPEGWRNA